MKVNGKRKRQIVKKFEIFFKGGEKRNRRNKKADSTTSRPTTKQFVQLKVETSENKVLDFSPSKEESGDDHDVGKEDDDDETEDYIDGTFPGDYFCLLRKRKKGLLQWEKTVNTIHNGRVHVGVQIFSYMNIMQTKMQIQTSDDCEHADAWIKQKNVYWRDQNITY